MIQTLRWQTDEKLHFLGRNGIGRCTGIEVFDSNDVVLLEPFTSKDAIGRCQITVPVSAIPRLIAVLTMINQPNPPIIFK